MRVLSETHASSHRKLDWESIDWKKVKELQMRIAKGIRERKHRLVRSLQCLLTMELTGSP